MSNDDERDLGESLPDEVLALIFSYLGEDALLDTVPLVCKRWCRLSKHPDAWRYIDVLVPPSQMPMSNKFFRIAKVAPCLRSLDLNMVDTLHPAVETFIKMLLSGNISVKNLYTFPKCTIRMQAHTKNLLTKFSPFLRKVHLSCSNGDSKKASNFYAGLNELLQLVSEAPRLNYLTLDFYNMTCFEEYRGQLGKGCSVLKHFQVKHYQAFQDNLIIDVLKSKRNQLVEVGFDAELSQTVQNVLGECCSLTKCRLLLINIPLVESMTQLADLEIGLSVACSPKYTTVESFVKTSNALQKISKLTLWGRMNLFRISFVDKYTPILRLLTQRCKNVSVFKMVDVSLPESLLDSLLNNFQNLQEIFLESCGGVQNFHVLKLSKLPHLRLVNMHNLSVRNQEELSDLENAFKQLQLSKPNVVVTYKCDLSPYGEDSDLDSYGTDDESDDHFDDYQFTYHDYLRNKYGDEISDMDLWALASSDEEMF